MIYDRRFGLPQSIADYLNQPLPDISGIFSALPQTPVIQPTEEITESLTPTGLTLEQLRLLYPQFNLSESGGEGRDDDEDIDRSENLGINSLADLGSFVSNNLGTIASSLAFGPVPTMIGKGIASLFDRFKSDPFGGLSTKGLSPDVQAAIEKDIQREAKDYNTGGDGGSKSGGRSDPYGGGPGGLHS